jgi:hypothetical protein
MSARSPSSSPRGQGSSVRLTFSYEGADIRLIDRAILDKPTRPSAPLVGREKEQQARSGFWVELHGKGDEALYRLVMSNPIRSRSEVSDDKGGFTNIPREKPSGLFVVVVPNLAEAEHVVLYSSPLEAEARAIPSPAEPIVRFALRDREED